MKGPDRQAELRSRYLLNLAKEEDREAVEAEFFADDASFERLEAAEDELFDAYASGAMPEAARPAFEERYLSSAEGRRRLAIAQALLQRADEAAAQIERGSRFQGFRSVAVWVSLAAALAAGLGAAWLGRQYASLKSEVERLQAERRLEPTPVPRIEPTSAPAAHDLPRTAQLVRLPERAPREPIDVTLTPETRSIRLEVALSADEDSASFDAVIRRPSGEELWRQEGLVPKRFGAPIVVMAPAAALADGEYVLSVEGEPSRGGPAPSRRQYRLRLARSR